MEKETCTNRVVIAGGGASGLCAGVALGRAGFSVTILEKTDMTGRKLSMTGNGRGNLSNLATDASCYNEAARGLVARLLRRFGVPETVAFFREAGVLLRSEEGYLYPASGRARQVTRALTGTFLRLGGRIVYHAQVKRIVPGNPHLVQTAGQTYEADYVILATGGLSGPKPASPTGDGYYLAQNLGLSVTKRYPALVRLVSDDETLPADAGVRVRAEVRFFADDVLYAREYGEVQITAKGLSGIPVLQAGEKTARALEENRRVTAVLDLFPDTAQKDWEALLRELSQKAEMTLGELLNGIADCNINRMILRRFGSDEDTTAGQAGEETVYRILGAYRALPVAIRATDGFANAQATAGGVALDSLTDALEARTVRGVYCIGELVDVNGRCGGYNLQWAWTGALCVANDITIKYDQNITNQN